MIRHDAIDELLLRRLIRRGSIVLGGNRRLKIFGKLSCNSGKRMKKAKRVFFTSELEATRSGFRPCGHCLRNEYMAWKQATHAVKLRSDD